MKIGIIGNGFVGKATYILKNKEFDIMVYDIDPKLCQPLGLTLTRLVNETDIIFISVPTPMNKDGSCHLNILNKVVSQISDICDLNEKPIVIRSTVPPGTSDNLNCFFMPEFLTEKNFKLDFINNQNWIFGLKSENEKQNELFIEIIKEIFTTAKKYNCIKYNNTQFYSNQEAEMCKLFRNNFLATKISFCNEIAEFCRLKNIDYGIVSKLGGLDPRIGISHTNVPGHDGKMGFGGTCFPKDMNNLKNEMDKIGMKSYVITSVLNRNNEKDRKEKDWNLNLGRAVID